MSPQSSSSRRSHEYRNSSPRRSREYQDSSSRRSREYQDSSSRRSHEYRDSSPRRSHGNRDSSPRRSHGYQERRQSPSSTKRRTHSRYSRDSPVLPDSYRRSHGNRDSYHRSNENRDSYRRSRENYESRSSRRSSSLTRKHRNHSSPSRDTSSRQKLDSSHRANGDRESRFSRKSDTESKDRWRPSTSTRENYAPSTVLPESSSRRTNRSRAYQNRRKSSPVAELALTYSLPDVGSMHMRQNRPPPDFPIDFSVPPPICFLPQAPVPPVMDVVSLYALPPPPPPPESMEVDAPPYSPNPPATMKVEAPPYSPISDDDEEAPPPTTTKMEDEAPGGSGDIPVIVVPSKYMFMPDRPKIKGKIKAPNLADSWGYGRIKDYDIMEAVGEGTYGKVYKAIQKATGDLVALKKVRLENEREGFPITAVREIKILRQLDHENVIKLIDVAVAGPKDDPDGPSIESFYLVFEYMPHDLHGLIESKLMTFGHEQIGSLTKQLLSALEHCHLKNFLHRDIKCSNILLDNSGQIKLADFGLSRLYHKGVGRLYTNRVITLWYRPPELLFGLEKYGPEVDIWSIGCILGEMFIGKPIFMGQTEQNTLELIAYTCGTPTPENWPGVQTLPYYNHMKLRYFPRNLQGQFPDIPSCGISLLDQLLQMDPSKRPTATEALEHPWISRIDTSKVLLPALPDDQECHEMWAKKMRRNK